MSAAEFGRHIDDHYSKKLYTRTEYDQIGCGEWRQVRAYCPRKARWVTVWAAPIIAIRVKPSNPDAEMTPDRLSDEPRERDAYTARRRERAALVVAQLKRNGPMKAAQLERALGYQAQTLQSYATITGMYRCVTYHGDYWYLLPDQTEDDIPPAPGTTAALIIPLLREHGAMTARQISRAVGRHARSVRNALAGLERIVETHTTHISDGRRTYRVTVYKLRKQTWPTI